MAQTRHGEPCSPRTRRVECSSEVVGGSGALPSGDSRLALPATALHGLPAVICTGAGDAVAQDSGTPGAAAGPLAAEAALSTHIAGGVAADARSLEAQQYRRGRPAAPQRDSPGLAAPQARALLTRLRIAPSKRRRRRSRSRLRARTLSGWRSCQAPSFCIALTRPSRCETGTGLSGLSLIHISEPTRPY